MEQFSMQILQNDVEYLGKNMKMVLQQLRILQEFVKLEFGSKFEDFYQLSLTPYTDPSENSKLNFQQLPRNVGFEFGKKPETSTSNYNAVRTRKSTSIVQESVAPSFSPVNNPCTFIPPSIINTSGPPVDTSSNVRASAESESEEERNEIVVKPEFFHIQYSDNDNYGEVDNEEPEVNDGYFQECIDVSDSDQERMEDPEYSPNSNPLSRKKNTFVTKHFKTPTSSSSKVECRKCGTLVSNRLNRLIVHLNRKCFPIQQGLSVTTEPNKNSRTTTPIKSIPTTFNTSEDIFIPSSGSKSKAPIRQFFVTCTVDGFIKSKCLRCGKPVSNKPVRLRNHYEQCLRTNEMENTLDYQASMDSESSSTFGHTKQNQTITTSQDRNEDNIVNPNFFPVTGEINSPGFDYPS